MENGKLKKRDVMEMFQALNSIQNPPVEKDKEGKPIPTKLNLTYKELYGFGKNFHKIRGEADGIGIAQQDMISKHPINEKEKQAIIKRLKEIILGGLSGTELDTSLSRIVNEILQLSARGEDFNKKWNDFLMEEVDDIEFHELVIEESKVPVFIPNIFSLFGHIIKMPGEETKVDTEAKKVAEEA